MAKKTHYFITAECDNCYHVQKVKIGFGRIPERTERGHIAFSPSLAATCSNCGCVSLIKIRPVKNK